MSNSLRDLIVALLDNEEGISEAHYNHLKDVVFDTWGRNAEREFVECVDATDGRFYFGSTIPSFLQ